MKVQWNNLISNAMEICTLKDSITFQESLLILR